MFTIPIQIKQYFYMQSTNVCSTVHIKSGFFRYSVYGGSKYVPQYLNSNVTQIISLKTYKTIHVGIYFSFVL